MKNLIKKIRQPKILRVIIGVILVAVIVLVFLFLQKTSNRVEIDDSLIDAPIINISPSASGELTEMDAVEGHSVKTGDVLAVVGDQTIRAQTDGIIVSAPNQTGGIVSASAPTPLIEMIKTQDLRVDGTLDENKGLDSVKVGQVVSFTVDAFPGKTFWGYVDEISPTAKTTQLAFSISSERPTQQFDVYAKFDTSAYPQIKNGMSAKLTIFTGTN